MPQPIQAAGAALSRPIATAGLAHQDTGDPSDMARVPDKRSRRPSGSASPGQRDKKGPSMGRRLAQGTVALLALAPAVRQVAASCRATNPYHAGYAGPPAPPPQVNLSALENFYRCSDARAVFTCGARLGVMYGDSDLPDALAAFSQQCTGFAQQIYVDEKMLLSPYLGAQFLQLYNVAPFFNLSGLPPVQVASLEHAAQAEAARRTRAHNRKIGRSFWISGVVATAFGLLGYARTASLQLGGSGRGMALWTSVFVGFGATFVAMILVF